MKAIVVYDSVKGADKAAQAICSGMKQMGADVQCKSASITTPEDLQKADLWVVGSSTGFLKPSGKIKNLLQGGAKGEKKLYLFDTRPAMAGTGAVDKLKPMVPSGVQLAGSTYFALSGSALMEGEESMAQVYGRNIAQG
jgi:flavorubredoxin